ncbi:hypothetical protein [Mastigocoleus sp. MO_188.B34]|uniref:hypothetical protein n=1 Tax=Mastigocoleus sp. MO_188.B34 TaxID=3036635 RepID=UPI00261A93D8|nr:hypothetical protein [Mastigocoleus sp. MO_188.B34]MDJ0694166.1 hypothetical protein [Mastigocoleus sp. MO_188.B34]
MKINTKFGLIPFRNERRGVGSVGSVGRVGGVGSVGENPRKYKGVLKIGFYMR